MKHILKKRLKLIIGFICGSLISGFAVYAATIAGTNVTYSTSSSSSNGATKTNVQDAIEELYVKSKNCTYLDNAKYIHIDLYNPTGGETQSQDSTFGCFHQTKKTYSSNGILLFFFLSIKWNATESSVGPVVYFNKYDTNATRIGIEYGSYYKIGSEEMYTRVEAYKVKAGDYFDAPTCQISGNKGRVAFKEILLGTD